MFTIDTTKLSLFIFNNGVFKDFNTTNEELDYNVINISSKYYKDLNLGQVGIENAYVVEIENIEKNKEIGEREVYVIYKIYTEDHVLVANVDNKGDVEFSPEFLEQLKQLFQEQVLNNKYRIF